MQQFYKNVVEAKVFGHKIELSPQAHEMEFLCYEMHS